MIQIQNYINGEFLDSSNNKTIDNYSPSTGKQIGTLPDSDNIDVEIAIKSAEDAFLKWKNISREERFDWMLKLANEISSNFDFFVDAESMDNGKPVWLCQKSDILRAITNLKFFASAQMNFSSEAYSNENIGINYVLRSPIGVVGCISPWNLPLYLFTWKIAPAIAAGNTVIAKPSELSPYTAFLFCKALHKINFPKGVINVLHGYGNIVGQNIVENKRVKAIAFTGGTTTGRKINEICAQQFKKVSLELGGKNPIIIFDDVNIEEVVDYTLKSSFNNQGQICLCGSRIFIHKNIYEEFKKLFVEKTKLLKVGNPKENVNLGSLISESHLQKILSYVELAKQEGGKILTGGKRKIVDGECENGFFMEPTIIENLDNTCRINQEEIFGPLCTLNSFENESEIIAKANDTKYGLATSIYTNDIGRANRLANELEFGLIWINTWMVRDLRTPFGGMKESGVGREGGDEAMRFFTEPRNVFIKY